LKWGFSRLWKNLGNILKCGRFDENLLKILSRINCDTDTKIRPSLKNRDLIQR
jgi:hypothetical protein